MSFTPITLAEFDRRPGDRLLALLKERGLDYIDFAVAAGMASVPGWAEDKSEAEQVAAQRQAANVALRHYTHTRTPKIPGRQMVVRWAAILEVDPGVFFAPPESS